MIVLVTGAPCSGKTSYVAEHRGPEDVVLDLDALAVALGAPSSHERNDLVTGLALDARDAVLARLEENPPADGTTAWLIASAPLVAQREGYRSRFPDLEEVHLDADRATCLARAVEDRPEGWADVVDSYFDDLEQDPEPKAGGPPMTTTSTRRKARTSAPIHHMKALVEEGPGIYAGIVSVFGNVDHHGDRILSGAFTNSLAEWAASGDPIPVIFSHQWDNLDAHVGVVLEAEELLPGSGDVRLNGTGLEDLGGLWTKFQLDVEEDFAGRLAKRLDRKSIREFSFAYDVRDEQRGSDGANELVDLGIIEVGPTLKGANGLTRLLSADVDDTAATTSAARKFLAEVGETLQALGAGEVADRLAKALDSDTGTKARVEVSFEGSAEVRQAELLALANEWAEAGNIGAGGYYLAHLEATYDDRVIVLAEGWEDPIGEGTFYELTIGTDEDGATVLENAREIEVAVTLAAKRSEVHRTKDRGAKASANEKREANTVTVDGLAARHAILTDLDFLEIT